MLTVEPVRQDNLETFLRYVADHGSEHDESYLPGGGFVPSEEHPAYALMQYDEIVGGVSLMRTPRYIQARRGRFSFFHCVVNRGQGYPLLFGAIRRHFDGLDSVYLFLPESRRGAAEAVLRLGFSIERYSYVMKFDGPASRGLVVPDGIALQPVRPDDAHGAWLFADAINANFRELAGHIPMQAGLIGEWAKDDTYLEDGIALLLEGKKAIGTVAVMRDVDDPAAGEVIALGVARDRRGRGLGRLLLRHAICFAAWRGLRPVFLSLNAENRTALRLYQSEGFAVTDTMVCYSAACAPANASMRQGSG